MGLFLPVSPTIAPTTTTTSSIASTMPPSKSYSLCVAFLVTKSTVRKKNYGQACILVQHCGIRNIMFG